MKTDNDHLLDRALRVLDLVAAASAGIGFNALLAASGLGRSVLAKILRSLVAGGMLAKSDDGYRLGEHLGVLARCRPGGDDLVAQAEPEMRGLAERHPATLLLLAPLTGCRVVVARHSHEAGPSMLAIGKTVDDKLVHPWCQVEAAMAGMSDGDLVDAIAAAATQVAFLKRQPSKTERRAMTRAARGGVGDDQGVIIPHSRRLAVRLTGADGRLRGHLVAGVYVASTPSVVAALAADLAAAAQRLSDTP